MKAIVSQRQILIVEVDLDLVEDSGLPVNSEKSTDLRLKGYRHIKTKIVARGYVEFWYEKEIGIDARSFGNYCDISKIEESLNYKSNRN